MKFIRTLGQHGIAGNIAEGIEIKTQTIFLLEKERKKSKETYVQQALPFSELSQSCMKVPLCVMLKSFPIYFEEINAKESLTGCILLYL